MASLERRPDAPVAERRFGRTAAAGRDRRSLPPGRAAAAGGGVGGGGGHEPADRPGGGEDVARQGRAARRARAGNVREPAEPLDGSRGAPARRGGERGADRRRR